MAWCGLMTPHDVTREHWFISTSMILRCLVKWYTYGYNFLGFSHTEIEPFITMTSKWQRWRLKSPASRLFTQLFIQTQIKKTPKAPRHWPLCGEFTGDRWIPRTNGQLRGKCFHLMTSSWKNCISYDFWILYVQSLSELLNGTVKMKYIPRIIHTFRGLLYFCGALLLFDAIPCLRLSSIITSLALEQCPIGKLQRRHNELHGISNHQHRDCLLSRLFRCRSKKTSKLCVTALCEGNSPVTGEFPAQRASNAENVSIWWRHHVLYVYAFYFPGLMGPSTLLICLSFLDHRQPVLAIICLLTTFALTGCYRTGHMSNMLDIAPRWERTSIS